MTKGATILLIVLTLLCFSAPSVYPQHGVDLFTLPRLTSDLITSPAAIAPALSAAASRPDPATICKALRAELPAGIEEAQEDASCSYATERYFVLIRSAEALITTARFKLNSVTGREMADLEDLATTLVSVAHRLGWQFPDSVTAAVREGRVQRCQWGILRFDFSRERGDVPRYNLILAFTDNPELAADRFVPWPGVC